VGHSRSHVIAQRERHKRRASRKLASKGYAHEPPHRVRYILGCVYDECWEKECAERKRRADREADTADLEAIDHGVHG
jgi:hypothetical protein